MTRSRRPWRHPGSFSQLRTGTRIWNAEASSSRASAALPIRGGTGLRGIAAVRKGPARPAARAGRLEPDHRAVRRGQGQLHRLAQQQPGDRAAVPEGAGPAQALEHPPVRAEGQPGVLPGHRRITDHDVVVGAPADPDDLVLLEAVAAALATDLKLVHRSPSPARAPPHGVPAVWLPGIRPPAGPRSMVIARAASL